MIRDADLDRILGDWLSEGPARAPEFRVLAALDEVARVPQRRRRPVPLARLGALRSRAPWFAAAAALIAVAAIGLAIAAGLIASPDDPQPTSPPSAAPTRPVAAVVLEPVGIPDWAVTLSIPTGWTEVEPERIDLRHFEGRSPEGHLSVGHESPYWTGVCIPTCRTFDLPMAIPYSAATLLDALKTEVARIAGASDWRELPAGVLPELTDGAQMESTSIVDGRAWRHVFIAGLRDRNVVAIAWSQPADVFDAQLWSRVLAGIRLPPAPVYTDGDLLEAGSVDLGFTIRTPGFWSTPEQPEVDGTPLSGVSRFDDGHLVVSLGSPDGEIGLCDPACRRLGGQTSLDELEASIRRDAALGPAVTTTLGGEPARRFAADSPSKRRTVIAMHDGRPVVVRVDVGDWPVIDEAILDQILVSFEFVDVEPAPVDAVFELLDGRVEIGLAERWSRSDRDPEKLLLRDDQELTVREGTTDGAVVTCTHPAAPWELCRTVEVSTLDELVAAVLPAPIADHGIGPPTGVVTDITLDEEPGALIRIAAYEHPARGGQEVVYILAFHDGRPYVVRIWTSHDRAADVTSVIAGFRFTS